MLPLVARAAQETLLLVPSTLREASLALGVSRWRTVVGVILPTTFGGDHDRRGPRDGARRRRDRAAPVHVLDLQPGSVDGRDEGAAEHPRPDLHVLRAPDPALHEQAWGAALVLMAFVLFASLCAKALLARSRRKLGR